MQGSTCLVWGVVTFYRLRDLFCFLFSDSVGIDCVRDVLLCRDLFDSVGE